MTTENDATGGEQPGSASAAATAETTEKAEGAEKPEGEKPEGEEGTSTEGDKPDAAKEAEDAAKASDAGKELNRRKQSAAERIAEVTRARRDAERRAEAAEKKAADLEGKLKKLNPADFDDPAELTAATVEQTLDKREAERLKESAKQSREEAQVANLEAFKARADEARGKYTDFDDVVTKPDVLPMSQATQSLVLEMEESADVMYHLAKNPQEAKRIDHLSERAKAIELGKIAARISTPPTRKVTKAPEPVDSVSGKSAAGASFDPNKASMSDYAAKRKAGWAG